MTDTLHAIDHAEADWRSGIATATTATVQDIEVEMSEMESLARRIVRFSHGLCDHIAQLDLSQQDQAIDAHFVADCVMETAIDQALTPEAARLLGAMIAHRMGARKAVA